MVQPFVQRTFFWEKTILARFILFSRIFLFKPKGTNYCGKDDSWESSYPPRFVLSTSESVFFLRENWRIVLTTKNPPKWPETDDSSEKGLNLSSVLFPKNRPRRRNLFERTEKGESRIFFSKKSRPFAVVSIRISVSTKTISFNRHWKVALHNYTLFLPIILHSERVEFQMKAPSSFS